MQRRPALVAGIAIAAVAGLAACGEPERPAATPAPRTEAPAESPAPEPDTGFEDPGATPSADPGAGGGGGLDPIGAPIATGEGGLGEGEVRLTVTELRRSGSTVVVNATLTRVDSGSGPLQVGEAFSDGRASGDDDPDSFDGVALIDPVGRKKYLVARDASGACVCSTSLDGALVDREAPVSLSATLTAPPAGVTTVDLVVPGIRTFPGVLLQG